MFTFKEDLHKIITHLDNIIRALSGGGVNDALDVMARRLAGRHKEAFDEGGHMKVGGPKWAPTDNFWVGRLSGKSGNKPMVWSGEAKDSVRQMGMAINGIAYIGAVDYIGEFQFGPLTIREKVKVKRGKDGKLIKVKDGEAFDFTIDRTIERKHREVFYVADSDWNPFMQHIAKMTNSDYSDVGAGFGSFMGA